MGDTCQDHLQQNTCIESGTSEGDEVSTSPCQDRQLPVAHNACTEFGTSRDDEGFVSPCQDHLQQNACTESGTSGEDEVSTSPCQERLLPVVHNACIESGTSTEVKVFNSSASHNRNVMHESGNDRRSPFDSIISLLGRLHLLFPVACFILFFVFISFLLQHTESFAVNHLSNSV